jgi:long-subunit acyl-CoA synthetase (AMP-forming)
MTTSFCAAFQATVETHPGEVALRTAGNESKLTWAQVAERVQDAASRLAGLGVRPGDTVAMMLANRPEFHILDLAVLHVGATPFSIYNTCPPEQIVHVLRNAGSHVVITEQAYLSAVQEAASELPDVTTILSIDGGGAPALEDLAPAAGFDFESAWRAVSPDDLAVLIYTSGTTGPPKGVQLTHRSLMAAYDAARAAVPALSARGRLISYLPHAHLADRFFSHYPAVLTGASITCVQDARNVVGALADVRPTVWLAVPRIWEKLKTALETQVNGTEDPAVHAALRAKLGLDCAEALVSGAAPIGADVLEFFASIGIEILEGYGMSECSAVISINRPGEARIGTVGRPAPGVELRLADDGEIMIRGEMVMLGYRGQPEQTAETIDPEGWLHTGDVGELDADGFVRIVDRKKELIVNAAGKNMSPVNIENAIKACSPLIGQAVAIGDRRPYNTALLVLDPDAATAFATEHGLAGASLRDVAAASVMLEAITQAVDEANARLSRVEQVKRWTLLSQEWLPGGDELTPTSKLKRKPIAERYATEIQALYD